MSLIPNAVYTATKRGISRQFELGFMQGQPYYPTLCTIAQSQGKDEEYAIGGTFPGMREFVGDRVFNKIRSAEYTITNKTWESSLQLDRDQIADDRLGMLGNHMNDLGEEARNHPDELLFELINTGDATACWDGQFFFDTDHSWGDSGTQSNDMTYNVTTVSAPTPQEFRKAFNAAVVRMHEFKRDNGKPWIRPKVNIMQNIRVCVPNAYIEVAHEAFQPGITSDGSVGITNNGALARPTVDNIPYLSSSISSDGNDDTFYVFYTGGRVKPFVFQRRSNLVQQVKGNNDIEEKDVKHMTEARYQVGYLAWPYAIRVQLT